MVNKKALERIRVLEKKYKENWGKDVDYTILPKGNHTGNARNDP